MVKSLQTLSPPLPSTTPAQTEGGRLLCHPLEQRLTLQRSSRTRPDSPNGWRRIEYICPRSPALLTRCHSKTKSSTTVVVDQLTGYFPVTIGMLNVRWREFANSDANRRGVGVLNPTRGKNEGTYRGESRGETYNHGLSRRSVRAGM